jgi:choline dehydrogenase-like flavoprotein
MAPKNDFIIVGAGAAGCLLADKLSKHFNVLLIEAGPNMNNDPRVRTPILARSLHSTDLDWGYITEPEPGLNDRQVKHPAGKLIGGSTAINSHVLAHSSKSLHDAWVELGNPDWSWESMSAYYQFSHLENDAQLHAGDYSRNGPIKASFYKEIHPLQRAWSESWSKSIAGGPGVLMVANAIDAAGERSHAGVACLKSLKNLTILQGQVEEVLFDGDQAIGVRLKSGPVYGNEIILCAGTFGSAKILELSGIGRGTIVPSWLDLPVGENLQDHPNFSLSVEVADGVTTIDDPNNRDPTEGFTYSYIYHSLKQDSLASLNIQDSFTRKVVFDPQESSATLYMSKIRRYPELKGNFFSIVTMYSYPLSRGFSKIQSRDPSALPQIKFNYLSDPLDPEIFARHVLEAGNLLQGPLKDFVKTDGIRFPKYESNLESIKEALSNYAYSNYHPCGTCSMMDRARGGVVDQNLKVYGTRCLRVCDASVIPLIPRANIMSTVYAIAGKAADIILAEHMSKTQR